MAAKILLVEDEAELRENLTEILEINGFYVEAFGSAILALDRLDEKGFDLIISDIMMPTMDGYEFLEKVRSRADFANLPFVFLTAKVSKEDTRKGMRGGAEDYLTKPIFEQDLIDAVKANIKKRQDRLQWLETSIQDIVSSERNVKYHELRTPLFGILSTLDYLLQVEPSEIGSEKSIELLKIASESAQRLNKSLLKLTLFQELPNLRKPKGFVHSVGTSFIDASAQMPFAPSLVFLGMDRGLEINEQLWGFIVHELLDNAGKFGVPESEIIIRVDEYSIVVKNKQSYLGTNFLWEIRPFTQIERSVFEQQGLGLGLYISQQYIQYSGGSIKAYTDDVGDFTVELQFSQFENQI
ncbi:Two-component response regulator [Lunatimonas lonarensis]|uniref:histidine kinase n=1 Tax=Lunatimonas lonarensis TaxID=1232681 RepID=R7ZQR5_9BACT|nr:response regulator [Lunatimonas lonarensis]EON76466.1 Two-component response regulator [Lunatimonas lonarensis]